MDTSEHSRGERDAFSEIISANSFDSDTIDVRICEASVDPKVVIAVADYLNASVATFLIPEDSLSEAQNERLRTTQDALAEVTLAIQHTYNLSDEDLAHAIERACNNVEYVTPPLN